MTKPEKKPDEAELDLEALRKLSQEQAVTGEYRIGEGSIYHLWHGRTVWKCRCDEPVPDFMVKDGKLVLDSTGVPRVHRGEDGLPRRKVCPALKMEGATEREAMDRYIADQFIPPNFASFVYAVPAKVPTIAPGTVATLQSPIKLPE